MKGEELRNAIRVLIHQHPSISASSAGHAKYAERYITKSGRPIALEPRGIRHQNIWVRSDNISKTALSDIAKESYDHRTFDESGANADLFAEDAFKDCDLVRFKVTELWQAIRILRELAGDGGPI